MLGTQQNQPTSSDKASMTGPWCFTRGIPQGSRFSPFLCALHMSSGDASLPTAILESLKAGRSALIRLVDDFLYISTEAPSSCCDFLTCLAQDRNPYGGDLNKRKCGANFPIQYLPTPTPEFLPTTPGLSRKRRRKGDVLFERTKVAEVPWAGVTIAPHDGLINIRQGTSRQVTDGLAVKRSTGRVWDAAIRSKLLIFLKIKLHPLLLDPRLNADDCVQNNLERLARFCAWRFIWLLTRHRLPVVQASFVTRQTKRLVRYTVTRAQAVLTSCLAAESYQSDFRKQHRLTNVNKRQEKM